MRNSSLRDRKILLTRPGGTSDKLRNSIVQLGGTTIYLPSMVIVPMDDSSAARRLLKGLHDFDVLIFVSGNAVKYARELVPDIASLGGSKMVFAIGAATHEALRSIGFASVRYTDSMIGSEALLEMDALQSASLRDRKVMILRGVGGRELLADELLSRGAKVQYVELYRRARADVEPAFIRNIWQSEKPDAVVVTSAEGLQNLLEMTGKEERPRFLNTRLVVISRRLQSVAESCGFNAEIKVARGYGDENFMAALVEMFEVNEHE